MKNDGTLADYGLNAVCTHLGCVVPWNKAENKFKCPCHGSQYNDEGKVIRGPAPLVRVPPDPPSGFVVASSPAHRRSLPSTSPWPWPT